MFRHATLFTGCLFCACLLGQVLFAETGTFGCVGSLALLFSGAAFLLAAGADLVCALAGSPSGIGARAFGAMLVLAVVAAVGVQAARWRHPTETLLGGYDEGVYAITAVNLAHTGGYLLKAPLLPDLQPAFRPWVIKQEPPMANRTATPPARFPAYHTCLFVADQKRGLLAPQFTVGFPALLGSAFAVFGYTGLHTVNFLVALGSAASAGLLAAKWLGRTAGAVAAVLMLWFPLHAWAANALYAEPLVQLLWLLALLGVAEGGQYPLQSGLLVGVAAGLGLAAKIDALPIAVIVGLAGVTASRRNAHFAWALAAGLATSGSVSVFSWWRYNRSYVENTMRALVETNRTPLMVLAAAGALGLLAAVLFARHRGALKPALSGGRVLRGMLVLGLVLGAGLALYAYFIRPHIAPFDSFYFWPAGREILSRRELTFVRLGWYWQPWGLAASVCGIGILATRARETWHWLLLGLGLLVLVSFCYDIRNNPLQPYAMRRFLPGATPLMALGAAGLWSWLERGPLRSALTVFTGIVLAAGFFAVNERVCASPEYPGLTAQIGELAAEVPPGAVMLTPESNILARVASPLEFAFERPCLVIRGDLRSIAFYSAARDAIRGWQAAGQRVILLTAQREDNLHLAGVRSRTIARGRILTKATVQSADRLVVDQTPLDIPWTLNEVPPLSAPHSPDGPP